MLMTIFLINLLVIGKNCVESRFTNRPTTVSSSKLSSSSKNGVIGPTICVDGWLPFQGSCYLFGKKPVAVTDAESFCHQHDSHLIHVDNGRENEFVKDRLRDFRSRDWWIGITDESTEGVWKWSDTDTDTVFSDFFLGQSHTSAEDCAVFWAAVDFKWADAICVGHYYPVCETKGSTCDTWMDNLMNDRKLK